MTPEASRRTMIIRGTPRAAGRTDWIQRDTTPLRILQCGRIRTDTGLPPIRVDPGRFETALVCLEGAGWVRVGTERFRVEPYDTVYVPRDTHFMVWSSSGAIDIAEVRAPVEERHPLQYVTYSTRRTESLEQRPGTDSRLCVLLGDRAAAGRISLGVIAGDSSRETAPWPAVPDVPGAEVACCYTRVPPASQPLAIEWAASSTADLAHVYEGDLVVGRHRLRADGRAPGGVLAVLWMLAAEREVIGDRFRLPAHVYSRSRVVP